MSIRASDVCLILVLVAFRCNHTPDTYKYISAGRYPLSPSRGGVYNWLQLRPLNQHLSNHVCVFPPS